MRLVDFSISLFRLFIVFRADGTLFQVISEHEAVLRGTPQYIAAAEQIKTGTEEYLKIKEASRMD